MNNTITTTLTLSAIALFLAFNIVHAGERDKVYDLAESGITIEFQMTAKEITVGDENNSRLVATKEINGKKPRKGVEIFEMGESGQTLSFPLMAEEIAAEGKGVATFLKENSGNPKSRVIVFELAESGQTIEFESKSEDKIRACRNLPTGLSC